MNWDVEKRYRFIAAARIQASNSLESLGVDQCYEGGEDGDPSQ